MMNKTSRLITLCLCFALALTPQHLLTSAQTRTPTPVYGAAYTSIEGRALYISGGMTKTSTGWVAVPQFFALDLTRPSWNTSDPPWTEKALSTGNGINYTEHVISITQPQTELVLLNDVRGTVNRFNIATDTWEASLGRPPSTLTTLLDLESATDPKTGLVYIPFGYRVAQLPRQMMVYDPVTNTGQPVPMPPVAILPEDIVQYSVVWSTVRNSLLLFGGRANRAQNAIVFNSRLFEYSLSSKQWTDVPKTGDYPEIHEDGCFVPAKEGKILIFYGGWAPGRQRVSDIYFLDTMSMRWTRGNALNQPLGRSDMACAVTGDYFVAWGGVGEYDNLVDMATPVIYNLQTDTWTHQVGFLLSTTTTTTDTSSSIPTGGPTHLTESNLGAILGGVAGGLVVILCTLFFAYKWSRPQKQERNLGDPADDPDAERLVLQDTEVDESWKPKIPARPTDPHSRMHTYTPIGVMNSRESRNGHEAQLWNPLSQPLELKSPQLYPVGYEVQAYDPLFQPPLGNPHAVLSPQEQELLNKGYFVG